MRTKLFRCALLVLLLTTSLLCVPLWSHADIDRSLPLDGPRVLPQPPNPVHDCINMAYNAWESCVESIIPVMNSCYQLQEPYRSYCLVTAGVILDACSAAYDAAVEICLGPAPPAPQSPEPAPEPEPDPCTDDASKC